MSKTVHFSVALAQGITSLHIAFAANGCAVSVGLVGMAEYAARPFAPPRASSFRWPAVRFQALRYRYAQTWSRVQACDALASLVVERLGQDLQDRSCPVEVRSLGRALIRWKNQIAAWHRAHVTNGPTEAAIIWSDRGRVFDVVDEGVEVCGGRVIWSASSRSPMSRTA